MNAVYLIISRQRNHDAFTHTHVCVPSRMRTSVRTQIQPHPRSDCLFSGLQIPCKMIYSLRIDLHFFLQCLPWTAAGEPSRFTAKPPYLGLHTEPPPQSLPQQPFPEPLGNGARQNHFMSHGQSKICSFYNETTRTGRAGRRLPPLRVQSSAAKAWMRTVLPSPINADVHL